MAHSLTHEQLDKVVGLFEKKTKEHKANGGGKRELDEVLELIDSIAKDVIEESEASKVN